MTLRNTAIVIALLGAAHLHAETIRVPSDHPTIQQAIEAAATDDEILVAPGRYTETIDLLGKRLTLRSETGADETIIDGIGSGPLVRVTTGEPPETVIRGFTITGGIAIDGGGMLIDNASPTVRDCVVHTNLATGTTITQGGGGLAVRNGGAPTIRDCRFRDNRALSLGGAIMNITNTTPVYINRVIHDNEAEFGGAFANELGGLVTIANCTITGNTALVAPSICNFQCTATIVNTISWGHSMDLTNLAGGVSNVSYSNFGTGTPGPGNIALDPRFTSSTDFTLRPDSPCIDAADSDAPALVSRTVEKDVTGKARFVNDPARPNTGAGTRPFLDMGAHEAQIPCVCERTGDDAVDVSDLLDYLAAWFTGASDANLNGDSEVDVVDLLEFLDCWFIASTGPCA